ncbi:MAG: InlB B-repeat-containing protein [Clostridia bacterium]
MFGNLKDRLHRHSNIVRILMVMFGVIMLMSVLLGFGAKRQAFALSTSTWDGTSVASSFAEGDGSEDDPYIISSASELALFMDSNSDANAHYLLTTNIDWNNQNWTYAQEFAGSFDGGRHTISNLNLNVSSDRLGFFPSINNATITNLILDFNDSTIGGNASRAGVLTANATNSTINNCAVRNVTFNARLTSLASNTNTYTGGLVGYANATTITNSSFTGEIINPSLNSNVGGLVGYMSAGSIADSYVVSDNISATSTYALPETDTNTYSQVASGLVGMRVGGDIQRVYVSANITASHTYTGADGEITKPTGTIYAISQAQGTTAGAFYDSDKTFTASNVNTAVGTAKTSSELTQLATYDTWASTGTSFATNWVIDGAVNDGYPVQRSSYGREILVNTLLHDIEGKAITTADENWSKISTTGSGMYLAQDMGASVSETANIGLAFDGIENENTIGYTFKGYMYNGAMISTARELSVEVSDDTDGIYYAVFTETIITPLVNIRVYDRQTEKYYINYGLADITTLDMNAEDFVIGDIYEYEFNITSNLYQFVGWQVNDTLLTDDNVYDVVNGEIIYNGDSGIGNVLTGAVDNNYLSTYAQDDRIEISALLKPTTFKINLSATGTMADYGVLNTTEANMQVGDTLTITASTNAQNNDVAVVSIKYLSNIKNEKNEPLLTEIYLANRVLREVSVQFTLTPEIVQSSSLTSVEGGYVIHAYVEFRQVIVITTSGMVDDGAYTKQFTDLTAKVGVTGIDFSTEMIAYQGQNILLSYTNPPEGIELTKFVKKIVDNEGGVTYEELFGGSTTEGLSMPVDEDTHIVAKYTRKSYDYSMMYFNSSTLQSSATSELISLTMMSDLVESTDEGGNKTYSTNKHYDQVTLTARLEDNKYKFIGFKWVGAEENVESATLVKEPTTATTINYTYQVTADYEGKTLYLVYTQVNMSLDFTAGVIGDGTTINDAPAELILYQDDEALEVLSLKDIVRGRRLTLTAQTKPGYVFAGWYKDGTLITTDAYAGYNASNTLYTPTAIDGVNAFVIDSFNSELSGIYSARYTKIQYTINVATSAGNTILTSNTQTTNNTIQAYVEQTIRVAYSPVANKKILGLTTELGGEVVFTDTILLTSEILELADANNVVQLYQVYEDKYLLSITLTDSTNCPMSVSINASDYVYTGAVYLDQNSHIVITLDPAQNYHYTITGLSAEALTDSGASFVLTADTTIEIIVELDTYTITLTTQEGYADAGTFAGADTYAYGTKATISVAVNDGYKFEKWQKKVGTVYIDYAYSLSFTHVVEADVEFRAMFIEMYTITTAINIADGGTITPSFTLAKGNTANIDVVVNEGYYIKAWHLNGEEMPGMANVNRLVVQGKANAEYLVELALVKYIFNLDQLNAVYGTGYTISAPQGEHYVFGEKVDFVLTEVLAPIRLNAVYANIVQKVSSAHVTDEHKAEFSVTIDNELFINNVCEITLDYTKIFNVTIKQTKAEGNIPTINSLSYISRLENTEDDIKYYTYSILDGTTITLNTSNNAKYLFRAYYIMNAGGEYDLYSNVYESEVLITADTTILADYIGVEYKIDYTYYVLNEDDEVIADFPVEYLSAPTYTYTYNGTTDTTTTLRYGDKIDIAMTSAPFGTSLHHFMSGTTNATGTITVNMNMTNNIAVAVYLTRDALSVNIDNITATNTIQVEGMDVLGVSGHGTHYIGDKVEVVLTNKMSSYFEVVGWKLNNTDLNFVARKAGYEKMTLQTYSGYLKLSFVIIPFDDSDSISLSPVINYKVFKVSSTVYVDGQRDTNANPVATTRVAVTRDGQTIVDSTDPSVNTLVRFKDVVIITFVFNTDYVDQYEFSELTLGGVKLSNPIQNGNEYSYTIDSFESANRGDYRVKFLSKLSTIHLITNLENAIEDGALTKNQAQYAVNDIVRIVVDESKVTPGYAYQGWYDGATLLTREYTYTFTFMAAHSGKTFTAMFQAVNYNVEIRSSQNGGVYKQIDEDGAGIDSIVGSAQYNAETGLTMYFVPEVANGYHLYSLEYGIYNADTEYTPTDANGLYTIDAETLIGQWVLDFGLVAGLIENPEEYTFVISATYDLRKYNVIISTTLDGSAYDGDALLEYNVNNSGALTSLIVTHGTDIDITFANVQYGYLLSGIIFANGTITNTELNYTISAVTGAGELVIMIERERFEVIVKSNNSTFGQVSGSGRYAIGDRVEFRAIVLGSGYEFVGFSYKGNIISTETTFAFTFDVMPDGDYEYTAEFNVRSIYLYAFAYKQEGNSFVPIVDNDGNLYNALTFQLGSQYVTEGYFDFGTTVTSFFREIAGYTCTQTYTKDCLIQSLSFNITESLIKNSVDGGYEIKVVYTIDTYNMTLGSNFSNVYDTDGNKIRPATLTYRILPESARRQEGSRVVEYNTSMKIYITYLDTSNYTFDGVYENGVLLFAPSEVISRSYEFDYTITKEVQLLVHYTPKIEFINLTNVEGSLYESMYTSNAQGIRPDKDIAIVGSLKPYLVVNYNGSATQPVNAGAYAITVTFSVDGLKDISIPGATYVIKPIEISFSFTGTVSKTYDGTATITDFSGLKFTDNLIQPNDKAYITLDTTNTTARFVYKISGVNYNQTQVGSGYTIEFSGIQLAVSVLQYEAKLNNYILSNNGQAEFNGVGSIVKKRISLEGVYLSSKIFDDTTDVVFANNYTIYDSYLNPLDIVTVGTVQDNVSVDYANIEYKFTTKQVGPNVVARGSIKSGTGLLGAKANNYELVLPDYTGFTIHPYQLTASGEYGSITITDVNRNLFLPIDLTVVVETIDTMSDSYRLIYSAIEPNLAGNKNFETAYTIKLLRNGFEYFINGSVVVEISTPDSVDNATITNVLHYGETINDMSITADTEDVMFMTGALGTFVLVSQSNPVPLWVIILVGALLFIVIIILCIYFFVIQPKKREKAYAKFNQI